MLAHFIEAEGIATTHISLIREHTEIIKPPRALWVPFPLGRPLGVPNDAAFQKKVLKHALELLAKPGCPILENFPDDAPGNESAEAMPACPVDFSPRPESLSDIELLLRHFETELNSLNSWYTLAAEKKQQTAPGVSGLQREEIVELFRTFISGSELPEETEEQQKQLADRLRLAAEDLKAFYFDALRVQPGQPDDPAALANWFWSQTYGAAVINEVRKSCLKRTSKFLLLAGKLLLVPRSQMKRFED